VLPLLPCRGAAAAALASGAAPQNSRRLPGSSRSSQRHWAAANSALATRQLQLSRRAHLAAAVPNSALVTREPRVSCADLAAISRLPNLQATAGFPSRGPVSRDRVWEIEAKSGLPSADRNNKATLLLTGPFRTAKSSAKDLTPLVLKLQYAKYRDALRAPRRNRLLRR
jgi:hypothetical protein